MNVGGNQAVIYGGVTDPNQSGAGPYDDPDGGRSCVFSLFSYALKLTTSPASGMRCIKLNSCHN